MCFLGPDENLVYSQADLVGFHRPVALSSAERAKPEDLIFRAPYRGVLWVCKPKARSAANDVRSIQTSIGTPFAVTYQHAFPLPIDPPLAAAAPDISEPKGSTTLNPAQKSGQRKHRASGSHVASFPHVRRQPCSRRRQEAPERSPCRSSDLAIVKRGLDEDGGLVGRRFLLVMVRSTSRESVLAVHHPSRASVVDELRS